MDIYIMNDAENKKVVLNVKVSHRCGKYILDVGKETIDNKYGIGIRTTIYPDNSRFGHTLEIGRKSQKKLDNYNNKITANSDRILGLWKEGNYKEIIDIVRAA